MGKPKNVFAKEDAWLENETDVKKIRSKWRDVDLKKIGRPKALRSPEELMELFAAYASEIDENPFMKMEAIRSGDNAGKLIEIPTIRPYTWEGFSGWLRTNGVLAKLEDYKANKEGNYSDFSESVAYIGEILYSQKFEGAAVGAFKENLIGRALGLTEKSESKVSITEQPLFGEDGD